MKGRFEADLPASVALSALEEIDEKITVTFRDYKPSICQLHDLKKPSSKSLMRQLKILTDIFPAEFGSIIKGKVRNTGHYKALFRNLQKDVTMVEIKYAGTGRIFGHLVTDYFCVVAIRLQHY